MQTMQLESGAPTSEKRGRERRVCPRVPATNLQHVKARLATGGDITLKDLSRTGARLESTRRMLPNSTISLTLATPDSSVVMTGLVVRSRIVRLADGLGYDVAVAFNQLLQHLPEVPPLDAAPGHSAPSDRPQLQARALAQPHAAALPEAPDPPAAADLPDLAMLRVTADIETSDLQDLFAENGW
jgi:hypothetical protein